MNEGGTRKVIWFIGLFPAVVFLFVLTILETELGKKDRYRTNSVYGFRSTKAVKNAENWRKAQAIVRNSSFFSEDVNYYLHFSVKGFFSRQMIGF